MNRLLASLVLLVFVLSSPRLLAYELTTVADGFDHPWCVAFLPDGSLLVTERPGNLKRVSPSGEIGQPITGVPPVYFEPSGQSGLFDVLPDPDFARNRILYLAFAHGDRSANATRVVRARLEDGALLDVQVIFTAAPLKQLPQHFGGKLAALPDGTLLITVGDGFDYREEAQNTMSLLGKTVRFRPDGSFPDDNPFADGQAGHPAVWTWGHRNPQGLARDPATGRIWLHEHGPRGGDELNLLEPGRNYGWPAITYGMDYSGAYVSPFTEHPEMEQPRKYWTPSIGPSGLVVYSGRLFPEWTGHLFVGALAARDVRRLEITGDGVIREDIMFTELEARIRDVREAPDGSLYIVTDGNPGRIVRVTP